MSFWHERFTRNNSKVTKCQRNDEAFFVVCVFVSCAQGVHSSSTPSMLPFALVSGKRDEKSSIWNELSFWKEKSASEIRWAWMRAADI